MKKLLLFAAILPLFASAQRVYTSKIGNNNAMFWIPAGLDTTQAVNAIFFSVGSGEQGTNAALLTVHGPFQYAKAGVDMKTRSIIVAIQNPTTSPNPQPADVSTWLDGLGKLYKLNKVVVTGLSRGGQNWEWFANNSETNLKRLAGLIVFSSQGTVSDYPGVPGTLNPALYLKYNIPIVRGVGDADFTWPQNLAAHNLMAAGAPKLDTWIVWPGAGHGDPVWADGYNPIVVTTNPIYKFFGGRSVYQVADSIMGVAPAPPVVYLNAAQSATYVRNNCACGIPSSVTYSVAAGKYTSTSSQAAADQLASTDMTTNGQAYANSFGVCSPIAVLTVPLKDGKTFTIYTDGSYTLQ